MKPTNTFIQSKLCVLTEVIKCKVRLKLLVTTFSESITQLVCLALLDSFILIGYSVCPTSSGFPVDRASIYSNTAGTKTMHKSVAMIWGHFSMWHIWGRWHILYFNCHVFGKCGHAIVKYLKLIDGCTAARTYTVYHWYEAFSCSRWWHFKRAVLRSSESDLFTLSSKQSSEVALLEPQTWHVF